MEARARVGGELRALRLAAGLSMVEAARRAEVSRMTLHRWETDASTPEIASLDRLLKTLRADDRARARILADAAPTPALPELTNGPLGSPVHIGQALRTMRLWAGMGQTALAQAVGVGQGTVAKWESGAFRPSDEALERLLRALRVREADAAWVRGLAREEPVALGSLLDARAWFEANLPSPGVPREVATMAFEREVWRRAARDARWEPLLAETIAWRACAHGYASDFLTVEGRTAAREALALARRSGNWDEVVPALALLATDFRNPARHERLHAAALERVKSPQGRGALLMQWAVGTVDRARGEETLRRAEEFARDEPRSAYVLTPASLAGSRGILCARSGDPEGAVEAFEAASHIREADYAYQPIHAHQYLLSAHRVGARLSAHLVAAARRANAREAISPTVRADWRATARTIETDP